MDIRWEINIVHQNGELQYKTRLQALSAISSYEKAVKDYQGWIKIYPNEIIELWDIETPSGYQKYTPKGDK